MKSTNFTKKELKKQREILKDYEKVWCAFNHIPDSARPLYLRLIANNDVDGKYRIYNEQVSVIDRFLQPDMDAPRKLHYYGNQDYVSFVDTEKELIGVEFGQDDRWVDQQIKILCDVGVFERLQTIEGQNRFRVLKSFYKDLEWLNKERDSDKHCVSNLQASFDFNTGEINTKWFMLDDTPVCEDPEDRLEPGKYNINLDIETDKRITPEWLNRVIGEALEAEGVHVVKNSTAIMNKNYMLAPNHTIPVRKECMEIRPVQTDAKSLDIRLSVGKGNEDRDEVSLCKVCEQNGQITLTAFPDLDTLQKPDVTWFQMPQEWAIKIAYAYYIDDWKKNHPEDPNGFVPMRVFMKTHYLDKEYMKSLLPFAVGNRLY